MWQVWLGLVVTASVTSEQDLPDFAAPPSAPLAVQPSLEARVRRVGRGFVQRCFSFTLHRLPNTCAPICFGGWPACLLRVGMLDCATSRLLTPASGFAPSTCAQVHRIIGHIVHGSLTLRSVTGLMLIGCALLRSVRGRCGEPRVGRICMFVWELWGLFEGEGRSGRMPCGYRRQWRV